MSVEQRMPDTQLWGNTLFRLKPDKLRKTAREIHALQALWQTPAAEYFKIGAAPPGYPNMRIITVADDPEIEGAAYEQSLDCEGILGEETYLELDRSETQPEEGWDEMRLRIFTREPDAARWARGARLVNDAEALIPGFENMYITARSPRVHRAKDYHELDLTLKGIKGAKPYKRRINGAVTSSNAKFDGPMAISSPVYAGYPPTATGGSAGVSGEDYEMEYEAGSISLVDTWLTNAAPPTQYIGQFWIPPDPPDVTVMSLVGANRKYFFPFGWKCTAMPCEQIPGTSLWLVSSSFAYQVPSIPIQ